MKGLIITQIILVALGVFGAPNESDLPEIVRLPIKYKIVDIRFSQDTTETCSQTETSDWGTKTKYYDSEIDTGQTRKSVGIGISAKARAGASASSSGSVSATVGADVNARGDAEWKKSSSHDTRAERGSYEDSTKKKLAARTFTTDDWQLRLHVKFENISTNQTLSYDPENDPQNNSGLFADVYYKGRKHRIDLPLQQSQLGILAPGKDACPEINTYVRESQRKEALIALQDAKILKENVILGNDSRFSFVDKETNKKWSSSENDYSVVVNVDFEGKYTDKFPVFMQVRTTATYRQVLAAVSRELPSGYNFEFSTDGALAKVLGRDFGKFISGKDGVYAILARVDDEIKGSLMGCETLSDKLVKNRLSFTKIGMTEMWNGYCNGTIHDASLISNCLSYIEQSWDSSRKISADLYNGARLAEDVGSHAQAAHFLSMDEIGRDLYIRECGKDRAICLAIKGNDVDCFKKLNNLGWGITNRTMLGYAAEKGALKIVRWLLEECPEYERAEVDGLIPNATKESIGDVGKTPLFWAAKKGHIEVCKFLVSKGANVNRKFWEKRGDKSEESYDELLQTPVPSHIQQYIRAEREVYKVKDRWWPSIRDPKDATAEKIRAWVNAGVSPDCNLGGGWNLISQAIALDDAELVAFLIEKGADVNGTFSVHPKDHRTALMLASTVGSVDLMGGLLLIGVDLYLHQDDGMNAFYCAIKNKNYVCARMLLDKKLDAAQCAPVEIDGMKLNLFEFVGRFCDDRPLCERVKNMDNKAWIQMLVKFHRMKKPFHECLDKCALTKDDILCVLKQAPDMAEELRKRGFFDKLTDDEKKSLVSQCPALEQDDL